MSLFDLFRKNKGSLDCSNLPIMHYDRNFRGSATKMAKKLINAWEEYHKHNPPFKPDSRIDARKAFFWICKRVGFDDGWAETYSEIAPGWREIFLGDLAVTLVSTDLLRGVRDPQRTAKAMSDIHAYFALHLPDQLGRLPEESESWRSTAESLAGSNQRK